MNARLIILIVLAGALAVYFALRKPPAPKPIEEIEAPNPQERADLDELQTPLPSRNLTGLTPPERPRFSIRMDVDNSKGKNRLLMYISEEHGFYADGFDIDFWYRKTPDMPRADSPLPLNHKILNRYLPARETLVDCIELTDAEMRRINEDMGTAENWAAEIKHFGHCFLDNPDPIPRLDVYRESCR